MQQISENYPGIKSLDFSRNLLTEVNNLQPVASSLLALNLCHNFITFDELSPSTLGSVPKLVQLDLSHNKIKSLRLSQLSSLQQLKDLDLSHNLIEHMDEIVYLRSNQSLRALSLANNPIIDKYGEQEVLKFVKVYLPHLVKFNNKSLLADVSQNTMSDFSKEPAMENTLGSERDSKA